MGLVVMVALKGHLKILILFFKITNITADTTDIPASLVQSSNCPLCNHRFDVCATVNSLLAQPSNRRLCNCRIDACATVDMMLDFKLWYKYPFRTWIYFMFSHLTSYLDFSYCNFRCSGNFFKWSENLCQTIILKSLNCKITNCKSTTQLKK